MVQLQINEHAEVGEPWFSRRQGPDPLSLHDGVPAKAVTALETGRLPAPLYKSTDNVATRKAFGNALVRLAPMYPNMVVLDADVQNSTYTELFAKKYPDRFYQMFIAEQNMVSTAVGMAKMGLVPVVSTFGCFLTRAFDQLRMAALSCLHVVVCGSHAGVSIGQDGPSQMGLEDLALFRALPGSTVLYPADAISCERLVEQAIPGKGIVYIRTTRPATPVVYPPDRKFNIGGFSIFDPSTSRKVNVSGFSYYVLREDKPQIRNTNPEIRATIVAAGITLHEALKAQKKLSEEGIAVRVIDCYSVKPIDAEALRMAVKDSKSIVIVEDHYPEGGLGEAVASILASNPTVPVRHLAVTKVPRSGMPDELIGWEEIDASAIASAIRSVLRET